MLRILAIGNSFSQDATAYLHSIANADGVDITVVNLYIGGCSLETHWNNILEDKAAYEYERNGLSTGRFISIKEALLEEEWDYVTLQQVSSESGIIDSYYPYITNLSEYVTQLAPQAIQLLHQTWAYELDSDHGGFINYNKDQWNMYDKIVETYQRVSEDLKLEIIPCGKIIQSLRNLPEFDYANGGISLCRDGFHMNLVYGRYAVAAVWYESIVKKSIMGNSFLPPEVNGKEVKKDYIELIQSTIHWLLG